MVASAANTNWTYICAGHVCVAYARGDHAYNDFVVAHVITQLNVFNLKWTPGLRHDQRLSGTVDSHCAGSSCALKWEARPLSVQVEFECFERFSQESRLRHQLFYHLPDGPQSLLL